MDKLYKLADMLYEELEQLGEKDLTAGSLETVDKLSHALKNLYKIIEYCEGEEEGYSNRGSYDDGGYRRSYRGGSYRGGSYRSSYGNREGGSYARRRRDSQGRFTGYSRANQDMAQELQNLMNQTQDPQMRMRIEELIAEMD